jgi:drug/metabolite transporter (DMT)-like permease
VGLYYSVSTEASTAYGQLMTTVVDPAKTRKGLLAVGAAAVTAVFWASAFVAIRHVGHEYSAGALLGRLPALQVTWLACTIGAVACLPFDIPGPTAHDHARVAVAGRVSGHPGVRRWCVVSDRRHHLTPWSEAAG